MINFQDFISQNSAYQKFEVDELLFTEFKCPTQDEKSDIWWHNNFFAYVIAGETIIITRQQEYHIKAGDCMFAKKGSVTTQGHTEGEFCELLVFIPDDFIKTVIQKYRIPLVESNPDNDCDTVFPLLPDKVLDLYFRSLLVYFSQPSTVNPQLLKLKFEELLISILSNDQHEPLQCYFREICASEKPSVKQIMETNFHQNLSLNEFAKLSARSLSSFKLEFKKTFHTTPGRWLLKKRLSYSHYLLENSRVSIYEICDKCGFENRTHFTRAFKNQYGLSPVRFRNQQLSKV